MKPIIILLAIMLCVVNVYAEDSDLIVDGKVGIGTSTPSAKLTVSGTFDPSEHLASPNNDITYAAPLSQSNMTTVDGATPVSGTANYVAGANNVLSIPNPTMDYSKLSVLGFQQNIFNYNPYIRLAEASTGAVWIYADLAAGSHSFWGGEFVTFHYGTGMASSVFGSSNTASITPGLYSGAATGGGAATIVGTAGTASLTALVASSTAETTNIYGMQAGAVVSGNSGGTSTATAGTAYGLKSIVSANRLNTTITTAYGVYSRVYASNSAAITNAYGIYVGAAGNSTPLGTNRYALVTHPTAGNVGIGTTVMPTGGSAAIALGNSSTAPTNVNDCAGIYAMDSGGTTNLYAFDEDRNDVPLTPHAKDAPDSLYDIEDGLPMIVKEVQHFLGYVRYTNQTRQARLAGMTDAEKSRIPAPQRTCVYTESFADHNARLGLTGSKALTKLDWEAEQRAIKAKRDSEIVAARRAKADLQASIATAKDDDARNDLIQQDADTKVPAEYTMKTPPARLRAALEAARW